MHLVLFYFKNILAKKLKLFCKDVEQFIIFREEAMIKKEMQKLFLLQVQHDSFTIKILIVSYFLF